MKETKTYLIVSANCLKNIDGYGTVRFTEKEVINTQPLITRPFTDCNPMMMYHGKIQTMRELNGRTVLNALSNKRYTMSRPVQKDEIFFAVGADDIAYIHYDKSRNDWIVEDFDEMADGDITTAQLRRIRTKLEDFYEEMMGNCPNIKVLQHDYLDLMY